MPSLIIGTGIAQVEIENELTIKEISGSLTGLTIGTFTVEVRQQPRNVLIATLTWSAPGTQRARALNFEVVAEERLSFDIVGIGTGQTGCVISIWWQ